MGNAPSSDALEGGRNAARQQAVTEGKRRQRPLPPDAARSAAADWPFIEVWLQRGPRITCRMMSWWRVWPPPLPSPT